MAMLEVDGSAVPDPSVFEWGLQDISSSDSGRTEDTLMHKNRVGQKRKIKVTWNNPTPEKAAQILTAFNPEYVSVKYPDAMSNSNETRTFYVGDRTAAMRAWTTSYKRYTQVIFDLIER